MAYKQKGWSPFTQKESALKLGTAMGTQAFLGHGPSAELRKMKHEQNQQLKARDEENKDELLEEARGHYIKKAQRKERKIQKKISKGSTWGLKRKKRKVANLKKAKEQADGSATIRMIKDHNAMVKNQKSFY